MKAKITNLLLIGLLLGCTTDRDLDFVNVIDPDENQDLEILHYWNFNDTSNLLEPNVSLNQDASLTYLGDRLDDVDEGSQINTRLNEEEGSALRLRNPSGNFIIQVSTAGFEDILLTYAVMRTNNGPQIQKISYSIDGVNYTTEGLTNPEYGVPTDFTKKQFDFSQIEAVNNNESFRIKIEFDINADGESGNSRFDNISIDAVALEDSGDHGGDDNGNTDTDLELMHYWNFNDNSSEMALITPSFSIENAELTYAGASFDDTNGSTINARNNDPAGTALRLRNPAGPFTIKATTANYEDIKVSYAARRTANGAQQQLISYSLDGGNTFTQEGLQTQVFDIEFGGDNEVFQRYEIDFSSIEGVNDNPNFQVQINFAMGDDNSSGNNRIDNLVVEGNALDDDNDDDEDLEFLLMHYWNFNDSSSDEALITPTFSFSGANLNYEGNFFDDTDGSSINARNNDPAGDGLRLRNPAGPFTISASTTNYENVKISYAARRTNNGAQQQLLSYSLDGGQSFTTEGLDVLVFDIQTGGDEEEFELFEIDLSGIDGAQNNADFQFQINFAIGEDGDSGNNRIDNLVIEGTSL
ncbi:MAG: hypothetical protein LAT51_07015 [Flavobacteriaceae bacterium]|nr:hypothetical protein [Flavobacteriaceae bacterium]